MKLIISFSARRNGNCGGIARYIAGTGDRIVHYSDMHAASCANCAYECFQGQCKYRDDGVYALYQSMMAYDQVVLIVPMYCGNPSALYFTFIERGQDFFCSDEMYEEVLKRLYIVGVYGSATESPDFVPCLQKWFSGTNVQDHVLGLERHPYGQKMGDLLLDVAEVRSKLDSFLT